MGDFHILPEAEADLDGIWLPLAIESTSGEIASRIIDSITGRIWILAQRPEIGRRRDQDLRIGLRSFPAGQYVIFYRIVGDSVFITRVIRGSRDIEHLFQD